MKKGGLLLTPWPALRAPLLMIFYWNTRYTEVPIENNTLREEVCYKPLTSLDQKDYYGVPIEINTLKEEVCFKPLDQSLTSSLNVLILL